MPGSVGVPTGAEIGVIDRERRFLPEGSSGEVVIRGPGVTAGYLNNPEANADAFFDGWFRTGDLGVLEDGYLRLEGRLKEMILRGGENISPSEIEEVLVRTRPSPTRSASASRTRSTARRSVPRCRSRAWRTRRD